jgi:hypothetical protein
LAAQTSIFGSVILAFVLSPGVGEEIGFCADTHGAMFWDTISSPLPQFDWNSHDFQSWVRFGQDLLRAVQAV